jgi:dTDP-4-amino-4,6-dideoxygalactose transaminase
MNHGTAATVATIPLVDLKAAHEEVADDVQAGLERVLATTAFIKGAEADAFEAEYAQFTGIQHCVAVANGTDAIELALRAVNVPPGAGVLLPANTFVATAEAVVRAGARPLLADVDAKYLLLDPEGADAQDAAAIVPVHLFGQLAPMGPVLALAGRRDVPVVEDAAQAHGATQDGRPAGSFGAAGAVSFYPGKNLGAYGDAGAVLTNSPDVARTVRLLGDHGSERKYEHLIVGYNSRLDGVQAAVLRAKLPHLARWNAARQQAAKRYHTLLADLDGVTLPAIAPGNAHVWHLYVIQVLERDRVLASLQADGIAAAIHYPVPVHLQPAFRYLGYGPGDFPVAEAAAQRILSLPIYPQITEEQQERVAAAVRRAVR